MRLIDIKECATLLKSNDNFLLLCHKSPDGDTLGSAFALCLALSKMKKRVKLAKPSLTSEKLRHLVYSTQQDDFEEKFVVAVDIADSKMLDKGYESYEEKVDLCIDHHISNSRYADKILLNDKASATCEIIFELLNEMNIDIDKSIADAIYTGICTDTGCFKYSNVSAKTLKIAAKLIELGASHSEINEKMFDTKSFARLKLEATVAQNMQSFFDGKCMFSYIDEQIVEKIQAKEDDIDGLSSIPRQIEGALIGIFLREKDDCYKASVRTSGEVDASKICKKMGGGGHICAAGCELPKDLNKAKKLMISCVEEELKDRK